MIKFESNMLVLDSSISKQDAEAINSFIEHVKNEEQQRVLDLIKNGKIKIS